MTMKSPLSVVGALIVGAAVGWLGFSGHIPVSHTVFATGAAEVSAARAVQTPGGRHVTLMPVAGGAAAASEVAAAQMASGSKPNILVIFGDDVGQTNISAYSFGVVGYHTPNIDRIAKEGMMFTDYYAENSCTAGRSTFITGEVGFRTGLLKVGIPGAKEGLQKQNITIAEALKPLGYATDSSARTTSAIVTSSCRPRTASTNSSATSITSMPRRSPSGPITPRRTRNS